MKTKEINFDGRYSIRGWRGIAFYLIGYAFTDEPVMCYELDGEGNEVECETGEFEKVEDRDNVIAVMVGDDRKHVVSVDDLTEISSDDYCSVCGQIGCHHNF